MHQTICRIYMNMYVCDIKDYKEGSKFSPLHFFPEKPTVRYNPVETKCTIESGAAFDESGIDKCKYLHNMIYCQ